MQNPNTTRSNVQHLQPASLPLNFLKSFCYSVLLLCVFPPFSPGGLLGAAVRCSVEQSRVEVGKVRRI